MSFVLTQHLSAILPSTQLDHGQGGRVSAERSRTLRLPIGRLLRPIREGPAQGQFNCVLFESVMTIGDYNSSAQSYRVLTTFLAVLT